MDSSTNGQTWEEYIKALGAKIHDENHTIIEASEKNFEIENILFVLTDSNMISASEMLTDSLHHLNNTFFVGMPTGGYLNSSIMFGAVLKQSHIPFGFGNGWNVFHPDYYHEFKGFQPDIWMPDINLEALSKFLSNLE